MVKQWSGTAGMLRFRPRDRQRGGDPDLALTRGELTTTANFDGARRIGRTAHGEMATAVTEKLTDALRGFTGAR